MKRNYLVSGHNQDLTQGEFSFTAELDFAFLGLRTDGILITSFFENRTITANECEMMVALLEEKLGKRKYRMLLYSTATTYFDKSALSFSASERGQSFSVVEAYITSNFLHKIIGIIYVYFNRPKVPTKIFTDKSKAIEWLKNFQDE